MAQLFSEIIRQQKILEFFGKKIANDGTKWIPVKYNRRIPGVMPVNCYEFQGLKRVKRSGKTEMEPDNDFATPIIGSRADQDMDSPWGFLKVPPTDHNIKVLTKYAEQAESKDRLRSKGDGEEILERRQIVPKFERMDIEDTALLDALASRTLNNSTAIIRAMDALPDAELKSLLTKLGLATAIVPGIVVDKE